MTWDKPKKPRQWLALLAPAGICVLSTVAGAIAQPKNGDWMGWALVGLALATLVSFGQSIWLARVNPSVGGKIGCVVVCFAILMMVNGAVSFAGCAVGFSTVSSPSFH
jgi:hypothetical protein